jgi:hypothetical protein
MGYGVAIAVSVLLLLAGIALGGAGHGWVAGSFGCLALALISFPTVTNGLGRAPSLRRAKVLLALGLLVCIGVVVATAWSGSEHLERYLHVTGTPGVVIAAAAYTGWFVIGALAVWRTRRVLRHGT